MFDFEDLEQRISASPRSVTTADADEVQRVWAMSDIHTDVKDNMEFVEGLDCNSFLRDALIIAGDVSNNLATTRRTFKALRPKFAAVFYVPGNHDLWISRGCACASRDSLEKLRRIEELCLEEDIETHPRRLSVQPHERGNGDATGLWIVPLLSWHSQFFDTEPDIDPRWQGVHSVEEICTDYALCRWPAHLDHSDDSIAEELDKMNDQRGLPGIVSPKAEEHRSEVHRCRSDIVISFSHFLPRQELLPEKRYLYHPSLAKCVGSPPLGRRVRELAPNVHIFGHTHFGWDQELEGVRYMSPPLAMPREREVRLGTVAVGDFPAPKPTEAKPSIGPQQPLLVWDRAQGFPPRYEAGWSGFYHEYSREPNRVVVLPDYVARTYGWDEAKHGPKSEVTGWDGKSPAWSFGPTWSQTSERQC